MDAHMLEILACPVCKGPLKYQRDAQVLVCRMDRLAYPVRDDVPVMLEEEARQLAADDPCWIAERARRVPRRHPRPLRLRAAARQGAAADRRQAHDQWVYERALRSLRRRRSSIATDDVLHRQCRARRSARRLR